MLPTTFRFIWPGGFGVEVFRESTNQQHELPVLTMFVNGSQMSNLYRGPSIDATYLPRFGSFGQTVSEEKMF